MMRIRFHDISRTPAVTSSYPLTWGPDITINCATAEEGGPKYEGYAGTPCLVA